MFYPLFDWLGGPGCCNSGFGYGACGCGCGFGSCGNGGFSYGNGGFGCGTDGFGCGGVGGWRPGGCGPCAGYLSDRFGNGWNPGGCNGGPGGCFLDGLFGFW